MHARIVAALSAVLLLAALAAPATASAATRRPPIGHSTAAGVPFGWGSFFVSRFLLQRHFGQHHGGCVAGVRRLYTGGALVCTSHVRRAGYATPF